MTTEAMRTDALSGIGSRSRGLLRSPLIRQSHHNLDLVQIKLIFVAKVLERSPVVIIALFSVLEAVQVTIFCVLEDNLADVAPAPSANDVVIDELPDRMIERLAHGEALQE